MVTGLELRCLWGESLETGEKHRPLPRGSWGGSKQPARGTVRRAGSSRMAINQKHRSLEAVEGEGQLR